MNFQPINPKPFLQSLLNKQVIVKLKFNSIEYHGKLLSIDNYMNLLMDKDVKEVNGKTREVSPLGDEMFIRCNNVLWICEDKKEKKDEKEKSDDKEKSDNKEKKDDKEKKDEKEKEKKDKSEKSEKSDDKQKKNKKERNSKKDNKDNNDKTEIESADVDMN